MLLKKFCNIMVLAAAAFVIMAPLQADGKIQSWSEAGLEELQNGFYDKAIASFTRAIEINPKNWQAYNSRGIAYGILGELDLAIADYGKAIEINPDYADAYSNRGAAWFYSGQWPGALADCSKALSLDPKRFWAQNQLAWILATCPEADYRNGKKALDLVKKALAAEDNLLFYDTLAAAYAECGEFKKAIHAQEEALKRLQKTEEVPQDTLASYQLRLNQYKAGQPWRIASGQEVDGQLQPAITQETARVRSPRRDQSGQQPDVHPIAQKASKQEARPLPPPMPSQTFSVQAGAFLSSANAQKQVSNLQSRGYDARVHPLHSASGKVWHLVLIGVYSNKDKAKSAAADLTARENIATAIFPMDL